MPRLEPASPDTPGVTGHRSVVVPNSAPASKTAHFAVGFRRADQHHLVAIDDRVARNDGRRRRHCVNRHAQRTQGSAGVAGGIGGGSGEAVVAVGERRRRIGPGLVSCRWPRHCPTALHRQTP